MGAEKSRDHFFHKWKVYGVVGETIGGFVDSSRAIVGGLNEVVGHRQEVSNPEIAGGEILRCAQVTQGQDIAPQYAGHTVMSSVVEIHR